MKDIELLEKLQELGVSFSIDLPAPTGVKTCLCAPSDMLELIEDPAAFQAKCYGIAKAEYLGCVEEEFNLRCAGTTGKGRRCKNIVDEGIRISPKEWAERQGEYCHLH